MDIKRIYTGLVFMAFLLLPPFVWAGDGNLWHKLKENAGECTDVMKTTYVIGFTGGATHVLVNSLTPLSKYPKNFDPNLAEREINLIRWATFPDDADKYVEGLDILFNDFKNRNIEISDALHVVREQIKGVPQEDIEHILLYLRSGGKDSELLLVRDGEGNIIKEIMFPSLIK